MHDISRSLDSFDHGLRLLGAKVGIARFRKQPFQGLKIVLLDREADRGGGNRLSVFFQAGNDVAADPFLRKTRCHELIVEPCDPGIGLLSDEAGSDIQSMCDLAEDLEVQRRLGFNRRGIIL